MIYVERRCILNVISSFERERGRETCDNKKEEGTGAGLRVNSENECSTFDVAI